MRYGVVYRVTNLETGKCYIGRTKNVLRYRWAQHCLQSSNCLYLKHAIEKYGKESFSIHEIASSWDGESLKELEKFLIQQENTFSPNGYNLMSGGQGGTGHSEETRQKMSKSKKGRKGMILTEEHRQNIRLSRLGTTASVITRQRQSESLKGRLVSQETRNKIRNALRGRTSTEETKQKLREANLGKSPSEETRKKLRNPSIETRQRMSASKIGKKRGPYKKRVITG